jgi:RNA polymerase sigma-70 factor (ECF subfamily)
MWNKAQIARGLYHLNESASGSVMSEYHTQAGISACHCVAASYETTDWPRILALYDRLLKIDNSPIIALNRAVAVAQVHGPALGVAAVEAIQKKRTLENYYLFHAVLAEFEEQQQNFTAAANHLRRAVEHTGLPAERAFLTRRLEECESLSAALQDLANVPRGFGSRASVLECGASAPLFNASIASKDAL